VAIGPKVTATRWGLVRFKPDDIPGNLMAVPDLLTGKMLRTRIDRDKHVEITVALTGRLMAQESIIYDFSHDGEGHGVVMPIVRIERVDFILVP
jgi:hypothetical protein